MTTRFIVAYNALKNAFNNDLLSSGDCISCAVGTIVANAQGGEITIERNYNLSVYDYTFQFKCTTENDFWNCLFSGGKNQMDAKKYQEEANKLLKLTGYTWRELAEIERVFERHATNTIWGYLSGRTSEEKFLESQLSGLIAVINVMAKLDNIEPSCVIDLKNDLRKHPKLKQSTNN